MKDHFLICPKTASLGNITVDLPLPVRLPPSSVGDVISLKSAEVIRSGLHYLRYDRVHA